MSTDSIKNGDISASLITRGGDSVLLEAGCMDFAKRRNSGSLHPVGNNILQKHRLHSSANLFSYAARKGRIA